MATEKKARVRKKERKNITSGVAHVNASFNNTMITITDAQGNTIAWSSSGTMGFKGSRKSTPYAAQVAAEDAGKKAIEHGMRTLEVEVLAQHSAGAHGAVEHEFVDVAVVTDQVDAQPGGLGNQGRHVRRFRRNSSSKACRVGS